MESHDAIIEPGSNTDFNRIYKNIRQNAYRFIGKGSGRTVFDLENGFVVKVARNNRGIAQNKVEYNISHADKSGLFAQIPVVSDRYIFLVMEKAEKINNIMEIWDYFKVRNSKELCKITSIHDAVEKYGLLHYDLKRAEHWGMIKGKPVVIDYGFTREVCRRYYNPFYELVS